MTTKFLGASAYDYRERKIHADIADAPALLTERGDRPIDPKHANVELGLDPVTEAVSSVRVEILGTPIGSWGRRHRQQRSYVKRRLWWWAENEPPTNAPDWLLRLIAEHTPPVCEE